MSLMNEVERKRFLDTLRQDDDFRATVRRELLTEELLNLPQTVATLVDAVARQGQTLDALVDVVAQQRQDFTALASTVRDYMERTITLIGEGFSAARAETDEFRTEMRAGFTAVDARFAAVDEKFAAVDARFTAVAAGFAGVDARFDQVDAELREIKDRLAS